MLPLKPVSHCTNSSSWLMGISPTKKTIFTVRLYVKKWTTGFRRNNVGRESRMSLNVKYFHVLRILYDLEVSLLILGTHYVGVVGIHHSYNSFNVEKFALFYIRLVKTLDLECVSFLELRRTIWQQQITVLHDPHSMLKCMWKDQF